MSKEKEFKPDSLGGCLVYIIAIVIFFIIGASTKNDVGDNSSAQTPVVTQEQKQKQLDTINKLVKALIEDGLIVNYKEPCYFYINERKWNALPYETKEQIIRVFMERYRLTNAPYTFIGYYSGERIQDAKNFKGY